MKIEPLHTAYVGAHLNYIEAIKQLHHFIFRRGFTLGADKLVVEMPERKRPSTLKTVKTFMRLGKVRPARGSSDEEQGLLETPGPSTEPDRPTSQTSMSSDEMIVDVQSPTDRKIRKT